MYISTYEDETSLFWSNKKVLTNRHTSDLYNYQYC